MKKERKLTVNLIWANLFCVILLITTALATAIFWKLIWMRGDISLMESLYSPEENPTWGLVKTVLFLLFFLGGIAIHELIHGATWAHFSQGGWKTIRFGVIWKALAPYCHCKEPLMLRHYRIGVLMPLFVLGIVPWIIGISIGSILTTAFGIFYISAASGDILVAIKLRKESPLCMVMDHPKEAGCIIYEM